MQLTVISLTNSSYLSSPDCDVVRQHSHSKQSAEWLQKLMFQFQCSWASAVLQNKFSSQETTDGFHDIKIFVPKTHGTTFRCYSRSPLDLSFSCTLHGHTQTELGHWRTWYRDICWMLEGVSFIYRQILNMLQSTEMRDYTLGNAEGVGGSLHELLHTLEPPLVSSLCLKQVQVSVSNGCDDKLMLASFISIRSAGKNAQLVVWPAVDGNSVWLQYWGGGDSVVQETSLLCTLDLVRHWIFQIEF